MRLPMFGVRLESHYVDAIDQLPGNTRREKITKLLQFALLNRYGQPPVSKPPEPPKHDGIELAVLEQQVKTLQSAFANLNHDYMALKNILGY